MTKFMWDVVLWLVILNTTSQALLIEQRPNPQGCESRFRHAALHQYFLDW